jgi:lysophospholipase L1-like esterase
MLEDLSTADGVAGQFTLPHTDQAGFQDENGNAYTNWYYTATVQYQGDKATLPAKTKIFQLASGQELVDLDKLPGGAPAMPYTAPIASVTSVNGQTGAVVVEGATDEAVAEQVTSGTQTVAALSATFLPGDATGATDGQVATWDATAGKFKPKPGGGGSGGGGERPSWATTAHDFDTDLSLYNPTALAPARQQFARAVNGSKVFKTQVLGDSRTYGATQSPPYNLYAYASRFRLQMDKKYKSAGTGITPVWAGSLPDSRATFTGTWTDYRDVGYATHTGRATGTGNTFTIAGVTCDKLRLLFLKDTTEGTFTLTIDGGEPINIDANAASVAIGEYTTGALALGPHTFVITAPATGNVTLFGWEGIITGGVHKVSIAGYSGAGIANISQLRNPADGRAISFYDAPDLAIIMLDINDWGNSGMAISAYKAEWVNVMNAAAAKGTKVLIVAGHDGQAPRSAPPGSPALTEYHRALYEIADQFNAPLLDLHHRWGTWAEANAAGLMFDDYHPNSDGHHAIAMHLMKVLDPGWGMQIIAPGAVLAENIFTGKQTINAEGNVVQSPDGTGTDVGTLRLNAGTGRTKPLLVLGPKNGTGTGDFSRFGATGGLKIDNAKQVGESPFQMSPAFANVTAAGAGNTWPTVGLAVQSATTVPLVAKGFASQVAPLTQWQNSSNVLLAAVTAEGAFRSLAVATGSRPSASTVGVGAMIYDTTLGKPIWSNGTAWTDATGTTV